MQQHRNRTPLSFLTPDRSLGKTDRNLAAASSDSEETTEVIRALITPKAIAASTDSKGDRSPGKTDRNVTVSESTTDELEDS